MTTWNAVTIVSADPDSPDARLLIAELGAELTRVTGHFTAMELLADRRHQAT